MCIRDRVYTNELGTDEILIRIGSENRSEAFAKEIKDLFRSKVRVAPSINFESAEYIAKIQMPPMSSWLKVLESFPDDMAVCQLMPDNKQSLDSALQRHEGTAQYLFLTTCLLYTSRCV